MSDTQKAAIPNASMGDTRPCDAGEKRREQQCIGRVRCILATARIAKSGAPRLHWFDLHNLLGMVTLAWTFVLGATGIMNALSTTLFGLWRAQTLPALLAPDRGQPVPARYGSMDAAVAKAADHVSPFFERRRSEPAPLHSLDQGQGAHNLAAVYPRADRRLHRRAVILAKGLPWYLRTLEICRPLHFGDYGGLPLKLLWASFALAAIAVLASGLHQWGARKTAFKSWLERAKARPAGVCCLSVQFSARKVYGGPAILFALSAAGLSVALVGQGAWMKPPRCS